MCGNLPLPNTVSNMKKIIIITLSVALSLGILGLVAIGGINLYVKGSSSSKILSSEQAVQLKDVDCILVLGCGVRNDGTPSDMLHDRLKRAVELYELGASPKLLMSGDHGTQGYDEVDAMKTFAVNAGIASEDVFMDHAGFSTYESMYRAKEIFQAEKIIIVTQQYHLYRAIYIAEQLGLDAYGVAADYRDYTGQSARDIREVLARVKDFCITVIQPEPTHLGEAIPIWGNGNQTNDDSSDFV